MIMPGCPWVRALKFLQKSMILTPAWPRAGPTGGAGVAAPAGICSLTIPVTFFAICSVLSSIDCRRSFDPAGGRLRALRAARRPSSDSKDLASDFLYLREVQLDRRLPAEDGD